MTIFIVLMVVSVMVAPASLAQSSEETATIEFRFSTDDNQLVVEGAAVVDLATGDRYVYEPDSSLELQIGRDVETELRIEPGARGAVLAVTCDGAERSKTILSSSATRLFVTPGSSLVSCVVDVVEDDRGTALPLTGSSSRLPALLAAALLGAGAVFAGSSRRVTR